MDGEGHDKLHALGWCVVTVGLAVGVLRGELDAAGALAVWAGYAAGRVLTPDLDLARSRAQRALRPVLPLRALGLAYARLFRHRGLSHWPIVGTLTRALWFMLPFAACAALLFGFHFSFPSLRLIALGFVGLCLADILHIAADVVTTRRWR